jgi:hypothetical protein
MAFLTLNGWTVPVADGQASVSYRQLGRQSRSYMGKLSGTYRSKVREWRLKTTLQDEETSEALEGLIAGSGQTWSFDNDLYSSKGLGPVTGYTITVTAAGGKLTGYVTVASNTSLAYLVTNDIVPYTMMVWKKHGGTWYHYAIDIAGTQYKNGVVHVPGAGDSVANWFAYSGGYFTIQGKDIAGVNAAADYDDLVIVPYTMPLAQILAAYTTGNAGQPFSLLPALWLQGDLIPATLPGAVSVMGEMGENAYLQAMFDGSFQDNLRTLDFVLREVQDVNAT